MALSCRVAGSLDQEWEELGWKIGQRRGAGRALDGDLATAEAIGAAVADVLAAPRYRASARELARLISATTGAVAAASRLERFAAER